MAWLHSVCFTVALSSASGMTVGQRSRMHTRIVNGSLVQKPLQKYSFFALPTEDGDTDQWLGCGASIISPSFALTSAHCFGGGSTPCSGPTSVAVWVGEMSLSADGMITGGKKSFRSKATLVCESRFDGKCSHGHDMALLRLEKPVPDWVTPVRLDLGGLDSSVVGRPVTSIGYGLMESTVDRTFIGGQSSHLREVTVNVLGQDTENCSRVYAGGYGCSDDASEGEANNKGQQLCAGATDTPERDSCAGDSGSPLLDAHGRQVGLVSYGGGKGSKLTGSGRECGDPQYPGIYARVSALKDFVLEHVKDLSGSLDTTPVHVG